MEAKEKALELIEKFSYWDTTQGERDAKRSALTCVDEMLEVLDGNEGHWIYQTVSYWQEVRNEIQNYEV
jgi:hypothetical protein